MDFKYSGLPENRDALGVLGYLIILNKQIHNFQLNILSEYLGLHQLTIDDTVIGAILDGRDDSVSYRNCVSSCLGESEEMKKTLLYLLCLLASADDVIDGKERSFIGTTIEKFGLSEEDIDTIADEAIELAKEFRYSANILFERPRSILPMAPEKTGFRKIWAMIVGFFVNMFAKLFGKKTEESEDETNENGVPDDKQIYLDAVSKSAKSANEDYDIIKPLCTAVITSGKSGIQKIRNYKNSLEVETGVAADVANVIKNFADSIEKNIQKYSDEVAMSSIQKERSASDFTISLLGRTKAGKSTLHSILTGQGQDKIGKGKQRTTRYNRVYQWNMLRIIDTPGIGSPEAEGRSDDEIAESVLGETDVICFVVVDDSILKDILEFVERIAKLNKQIIILLNHKEDITKNEKYGDVKFHRFLENPSDWLSTSGESNLDGHINRIMRYAADRGFDHQLKVLPVFLLAAQLAYHDDYREYSDILWEASNIEAFFNQLRDWIILSGPLKRSQTILDEASQLLGSSKKEFQNSQDAIRVHMTTLDDQRKELIENVNERVVTAKKKIREILEEHFSDLANRKALTFAEESFGKKGSLKEHWDEYLRQIHFEEQIMDDINVEIEKLNEYIRGRIQEIFEDMYYSMKYSFDMDNMDIPNAFNWKLLFRVMGAVLNLAGLASGIFFGSNPIGWALAGLGTLFGFGSMFMSAKDALRRKAVNKMYTQIKESIENQQDDIIKDVMANISLKLAENTKKIDEMFDELKAGLEDVIAISDDIIACYDKQISEIDKVYAWRILQFVENRTDSYSRELVNDAIISVDRSIKGTITIESRHRGLDVSRLENVITDKVIIV